MPDSRSDDLKNEVFGCSKVNPKYCETCIFVKRSTYDGKKLPKNGLCRIYEYPESKPDEVLFNGAPCEYYEKEKPNK